MVFTSIRVYHYAKQIQLKLKETKQKKNSQGIRMVTVLETGYPNLKVIINTIIENVSMRICFSTHRSLRI